MSNQTEILHLNSLFQAAGSAQRHGGGIRRFLREAPPETAAVSPAASLRNKLPTGAIICTYRYPSTTLLFYTVLMRNSVCFVDGGDVGAARGSRERNRVGRDNCGSNRAATERPGDPRQPGAGHTLNTFRSHLHNQ